MIRKISGKHSAQKFNYFYVNGVGVTHVSDIVNTWVRLSLTIPPRIIAVLLSNLTNKMQKNI